MREAEQGRAGRSWEKQVKENRKMKFSKAKFLKNAPIGIRRQLKGHEDALDGVEVIFDGRFGRDGYIPRYLANGKEYYLYPVYRSWCYKSDDMGDNGSIEEVQGNGMVME